MHESDPDQTITLDSQPSAGSARSKDTVPTYYDILPPLLRPLPSKAPAHSDEALSTVPPMTALSGLLFPLRRPYPPVFAIGYPIRMDQIDSLSRSFDPKRPIGAEAFGGGISQHAMARTRSALRNACGCKVLDLTFVINHPTECIVSLGDSYHIARLEREVKTRHIRKLREILGVEDDEEPKWYITQSHSRWRG